MTMAEAVRKPSDPARWPSSGRACSACRWPTFCVWAARLPARWPACTPPANCTSTCARPKCTGRRPAASSRSNSGRRKQRGADNQLLGSIDPGYASPELLQNGTVDARSDLFSLGCILYALSTGHGPFWGATPADLARSVRESRSAPGVPVESAAHGLAGRGDYEVAGKGSSRRFADAAQLSDMLSLQASMAGTLRRPPPRSVTEPPTAVRVPIGAVLASAAAIEPACSQHNGNGHHGRAMPSQTVSNQPRTDLNRFARGPTYWRRTVLAGTLRYTTSDCRPRWLAGWWLQPTGSRPGATTIQIRGATGRRAGAGQRNGAAELSGESMRRRANRLHADQRRGQPQGRGIRRSFRIARSGDRVRCHHVRRQRHLAINSIRAIYLSGHVQTLRPDVRPAAGKGQRESKPGAGYAVGGIFVRPVRESMACGVRFMRQPGKSLDPKILTTAIGSAARAARTKNFWAATADW